MPKKTSVIKVVTKKDLQELATQAGIKIVEKSLRTEILKVEERTENIEESVEDVEGRLERVEAKVDKIAEVLDGFVGVVDNLRTDNVVAAEKFREHEKRISRPESTAHSV